MSSTILGGDLTVHFLNENRQKRIVWTGAATGTRTISEVHNAMNDLLDELGTMQHGSAISRQTPTEYTAGIIDAGDKDPWFTDRVTVEHLTNGALQTSSWARVVGTNTGIVKIGYAQTVALVTADIGKDVLMTVDGDRGTLLDFNATTLEMWIRPDSSAAANSFDDAPTANGAWTIVGGTGTGTQAGGTSLTGESLWAGKFTLGTLDGLAQTHMYINQNGTLLTGYKSTTDWWADGHIDILVNVKEVGVEIDEAVTQTFARQGTKTYGFFETDLSPGGRQPIPLSAGDDIGNPDGTRQMVLTTAATGFVEGDVITDDTDATISGIVTRVTGTVPNQTIQYYLIGDPLNDFTGATGAFTASPSTATATAVAPTNVNAATFTDVTVAHAANSTFDINEDGTNEDFSIAVTCAGRPLTEVVPRLMFIEQRGGTTTTDTDGQQGQFYLGTEWNILYTTLVGSIAEGAIVTQVTSGATGTVLAHHLTAKRLILRTTRGAFDNTNNIEVDGSNRVTGPTSTQIAAPFANPFGSFPGAARFFGANGVVLSGLAAADLNKWETVDDNFNKITAPIKVNATVTDTRANDKLTVWRLTAAGGDINKTEFTVDAAQGGANSTSIKVDPNIPVDVVGKSTGSILFVADNAGEIDDRFRFTSWAGDLFTLFTIAQATADAGSTQTIITRVGETFITKGVQAGDIVFNATETAYAYIISVDTEIQVTTTNVGSTLPVTSWASDLYHVGVTPKAYATTDNAFAPFLNVREATGTDAVPGTETAEVVFLANVPVRIVGRQAGVIRPSTSESTITNLGMSVALNRQVQN